MDGESGELTRVRSMNRKDRDRGAEMWLTERTRKLIPETRRGVPKGAISYTQGGPKGEPADCLKNVCINFSEVYTDQAGDIWHGRVSIYTTGSFSRA